MILAWGERLLDRLGPGVVTGVTGRSRWVDIRGLGALDVGRTGVRPSRSDRPASRGYYCRCSARLPPRVVAAPLDPGGGGVRGAYGPGGSGRAGADAAPGPPGHRRGCAAPGWALALPHRSTGAGAA